MLLVAIVVGIVALVIFVLFSAGEKIKNDGFSFKAEGKDKDGNPVSMSVNIDPSKFNSMTTTTTEAPLTDLIAGQFEYDVFNNYGRFTSASVNDLSSLPYRIAHSEEKLSIKRDSENSFTMTLTPAGQYAFVSSEKEVTFTSGKAFKLARFVDSHTTVDVTITVGESSWDEQHVGYQTVHIKRQFSKEGIKVTYTQGSVSYEKTFTRKRG